MHEPDLDIVIDVNPEPRLIPFVIGRLRVYLETHGVQGGSFRVKIERVPFSAEAMGDGKIRLEGLRNKATQIVLIVPLPAVDLQTIVSCQVMYRNNSDISGVAQAIVDVGGAPEEVLRRKNVGLKDAAKASVEQKLLFALYERNMRPDIPESATDIIMDVGGLTYTPAYQRLRTFEETGLIVSHGKEGRIVKYELTEKGQDLIDGLIVEE